MDSRARHILSLHRRGLLRGGLGLAALAAIQPAAAQPPPGPALGFRRWPFTLGVASGEPAPDELLAHVAPLGWRHISLTGDYLWQNAAAELDQDGYRALNIAGGPGAKVA